MNRIVELISEFSPNAKTCFDLAGNAGHMSYLLYKQNKFNSIICADYDELAIEYGYHKLQGKDIHLIVANCMYDLAKISKEVKSDVVLALAVTHHLILTQNLNIDYILNTISSYSKKHVYIEFCPLGLYSAYGNVPEVPAWYTEEWFEKYFCRHFNLLHKEVVGRVKIDDVEKVHRVLFIGEKSNRLPER